MWLIDLTAQFEIEIFFNIINVFSNSELNKKKTLTEPKLLNNSVFAQLCKNRL